MDANNPLILEDLCIVSYMQGQFQQSYNLGQRALQLDASRSEARKYVELASQRIGL